LRISKSRFQNPEREAPHQSLDRQGDKKRVGSGTGMARHRLENRRLRAILYFKGGAYGGKKSAAINEKAAACFAKSPAAFEHLSLAISVKHLKASSKYTYSDCRSSKSETIVTAL